VTLTLLPFDSRGIALFELSSDVVCLVCPSDYGLVGIVCVFYKGIQNTW